MSNGQQDRLQRSDLGAPGGIRTKRILISSPFWARSELPKRLSCRLNSFDAVFSCVAKSAALAVNFSCQTVVCYAMFKCLAVAS